MRSPSKRRAHVWTSMRGLVLGVTLLVTFIVTAAVHSGKVHSDSAPSSLYQASEHLGVYKGSANPPAIRQFEIWLGHPVVKVMEFLPYEDWRAISEPQYALRSWAHSPYRGEMVYSVPLLPHSGGSLTVGAAGRYNAHFRKLARLLVKTGQGSSILRLGWEFNGNWYRWSAARDPGAFVAYWRQIVTTMRSVRGARGLKFDWCTSLGKNSIAPPRAYPGDAYVDYIGMDSYDQGWEPGWQDPHQRWQALVAQPYGLKWQVEFAARHGKAASVPEWGLTVRPDGHGGGDDPYYVEQMWLWLQEHRYSYDIYLDGDAEGRLHSLTGEQFSQSAAVFRRLYG